MTYQAGDRVTVAFPDAEPFAAEVLHDTDPARPELVQVIDSTGHYCAVHQSVIRKAPLE